MPNKEIEEFARLLIQQVRDEAIRSCDRMLDANAKGPRAMRWKETLQDRDRKAIESMIPDIVDETVWRLLRAIDDEALRLSFTASNGKLVNLSKEGLGEFGGWYMGSPGWRHMHARERFADDLSDLSLDDLNLE
jgi:hypothetical protein